MAFSISHDETVPADHTTFQSQPGAVRNTKTSLRERLQFGGVYFPSTHDELAGEHSYVRLANQGSAPTAVTGKWMLYVTSSGLFVRGPDGTSIQITGTAAISGSSFVTGDWIISTVTTAHGGWTNVSATYSDKFMRINATPLTTGGADTHSHGTHTHTGPGHTHSVPALATETFGGSGAQAGSGSQIRTIASTSGSGGTGATGSDGAASGSNVPAYVQVVIFQKDA